MKENINKPIYTLTGIVIHGRGIGKHVGTPTANIEIAKNTFLPKTGVYVADILLSGKIYYGVTHIGTRPTLDNDSFVSIETHIFDFDKDIYIHTISSNMTKVTASTVNMMGFLTILRGSSFWNEARRLWRSRVRSNKELFLFRFIVVTF